MSYDDPGLERHAYHLQIGDTVLVNDGRRFMTQGTVERFGRVLVYIAVGGKATPYYRDGQRRRDGQPGYFRTMEQSRQATGRRQCIETLRQSGVELLTHRQDWTLDQLEQLLAAVREIRR